MKGNRWLAGFAVFALLLIGGTGFFFFKGFGEYRSAYHGWDDLASKIKKLERETPYPSRTNQQEIETQLGDYEGKVKSLYESLAKFQKPLDETMLDRDFPQKLKTRVEGFQQLAGEKGLTVEAKDEAKDGFYLGFNAYSSSLPKPSLVPLLNYQLDATNHLLKQLVESGASRLTRLSREALPGEDASSGEPVASSGESEEASDGGSVVQKFPIKIDFVCRHQAFQNFVNRIANDEEYFFILRALRVENSAPDGPKIAEESQQAVFVKDGGETASQGVMEENGLNELARADFVAKMAEAGYRQVSQDARILFGQEDLKVEAVIDLVRVLPPQGGEGSSGEE